MTPPILTRDDLLPLRGCKVEVELPSDTAPNTFLAVTRVLRFLPPDDTAVLADDAGHETRVPLAELHSVTDARRPCDHPACGPASRYNNVFTTTDGRDLCADHYRPWAQSQPAPIMRCGECAEAHPDNPELWQQAFYSPGDKTYACVTHHASRRAMTGLGVEARYLAVSTADCRGGDIDDTRHRWFKVKGHRYHCVKCEAKRFTDPPLDQVVTR